MKVSTPKVDQMFIMELICILYIRPLLYSLIATVLHKIASLPGVVKFLILRKIPR